MDSGLRRNDTVDGARSRHSHGAAPYEELGWDPTNEAPSPHPHRISLGLDPRAIPNPAQAASGPRVRPEGKPVFWNGLVV